MAIDHAPGIGASSPDTPEKEDAQNRVTSDDDSTSLKGATANRPPEEHDSNSTTTETDRASTLLESADHHESMYRRFLRSKFGKATVGAVLAVTAGGVGAGIYHAATTPTPAAHGPAAPGHEHDNQAAPDTYDHTYDALFAPYITQSNNPDKQTELAQEQNANGPKIAEISPSEAKKLSPTEQIIWGDQYIAALDGGIAGSNTAVNYDMLNTEQLNQGSQGNVAQETASGLASMYQHNLYEAADTIAQHPDKEAAILQAFFPEATDKMRSTVDPLAQELRNTRLLEGTSGSGFLENMHGVLEGVGSTLTTEKMKDGSTIYSLKIGNLPRDGGYYGGDLEFDASQLTDEKQVTFIEHPIQSDGTNGANLVTGIITVR